MKATLHNDGSEVHITLSATNLSKLQAALDSGLWGRMNAFSVRAGRMEADPPEPTILIRVQPDDVHYHGSRDNRMVSDARADDYNKDGEA